MLTRESLLSRGGGCGLESWHHSRPGATWERLIREEGREEGREEEREPCARIERGRSWWSPNPRPDDFVGWRGFANGFLWAPKASERRAEDPAGEGATEHFTCLNF